MKTVAIIAEFNPFHNGHKYIIEKAKEITKADKVIIIMSGAFTQQGNIAIIDKFTRAEIASLYGADLVLELPTIFATSGAEMFARGAINILNSLNIVDYIAFGTECDDISILQTIAKKITNNENLLNEKIKENIKKGISYASARSEALKSILTEAEYTQIASPNNILAIEYLKSLILLNSSIKPVGIRRNVANHNDINVTINSTFSSATSIREHVQKKEMESIIPYVPKETYEALEKVVSNNDMYSLLRFVILQSDVTTLENIYEVSEGLENKIKDSIIASISYSELLNSIKSKRYTMSRIKRILAHILLNIKHEDFEFLKDVAYARVLKVKDKDILSTLSKKSTIPVISNINEKILSILNEKVQTSLNLDFNAENIYSIVETSTLNKDRINKL